MLLQRGAPSSTRARDNTAQAPRIEAPTAASTSGGTGEASTSTKGTSEGGGDWFELKNNTSVYVTGLPYEVTVEEVAVEFSKCGVIKTNDDGSPKIKLYQCAHRLLMLRLGSLAYNSHAAHPLKACVRNEVPAACAMQTIHGKARLQSSFGFMDV